jgi:Domain of unknown function (DUF4383)
VPVPLPVFEHPGGVLGFIPGITTDFGDLSFAGHQSDARLLGLFQVSILHNIVHLLFGIAGLAMARTAAQVRNYLVFGGAIYLVLFVYGLIVGQESAANFVPVNTADDSLHLILGIGMVGLGLALTRDRGGVPAPLAETPAGVTTSVRKRPRID